jgi:hypothetical protein
VPLVEGGPPFGRANLRVLCRGTTVAGLPDYPGSTDEPQLKER